MKKEYNEELLGKIVRLAKNGVGGEKANAVRLLKTLCKKYKLDFAEVMEQGEAVREYAIPYKKEMYVRLVSQIIYKYCDVDDVMYNSYRKMVFVNTTQEKYIETLNAIDVLVKLYEKERKKLKDIIFYGFLDKHRLYSNPKEGRKHSEPTKEELEVRRAGSSIADSMEDAHIQKRLN